eukprot:CAMPEP_0178919550 /NCGR_PEP_ID=MMETSP0786-20121207/14499_1 /TAXON_ID=186022 /ORGANISM="Thalassionema frauenfeldii, Strain CCMP 1798" /LENGTH=536 /DNA_ID=CAMNT_0020593493 /DNA_START=60 /DNA_END=1667 /DNA_ORIENTATION=+
MMKLARLSLMFAAATMAELIPRDTSELAWETQIDPASQGNECTMYGDDQLLICSTRNGNVFALRPYDGTEVWKHEPQAKSDNQLFSSSGIALGENPTIGKYIVHAVSEGFARFDPSYCVVYALNPTNGEVFWDSQKLEGACSGTPVISNDGVYIFLTHNLVNSGTFTVLVANLLGFPLLSKHDPIQPFSPPGIFHNPQEGYYQGGSGNRNDIVVWAYQPKIDEIGVGTSSMFVFQFPIGFQGESDNVSVQTLNDVTWQTHTAPRIFNQGYSMNFAVTKNSYRSWNGDFGDPVNRFDKRASANVEYIRGDPKSQAPFSALEMSSDADAPLFFGGTAAPIFVAFDSFLDELWTVDVTFPVHAEARVSPDDKTVYFVERNGKVHAVEVQTGDTRWEASLGGIPVVSNFGQSKSGKYLYFNDQSGMVKAWQVADGPSPTPSQLPSIVPSKAVPPTAFPSVIPTNSPSNSPTTYVNLALLPSSSPSEPPVTDLPTEFPSSPPQNLPTSKPTPALIVNQRTSGAQVVLIPYTVLAMIFVLKW